MLLYNWQAGLFYQFNDNHEARLTYARKNHFPTMSQRYSTRFGMNLPNPNLGPEQANHFELGYRGNLFDNILTIDTCAYYSIVRGKIATVEIPNPENPNAIVDYSVNLDSTSFYGFEFSPLLLLNDYFNLGFSFSVTGYTIHHMEAEGSYLPYFPPIVVNGYMVIHPWLKQLSVIPRFEYVSSRYADTLGTGQMPGYFLLHLRISADFGPYVSVSAGVNNILDTFYELRRYSPQEGRSFYFTLELKY
jgi:iron complex outermembrane receptor protein